MRSINTSNLRRKAHSFARTIGNRQPIYTAKARHATRRACGYRHLFITKLSHYGHMMISDYPFWLNTKDFAHDHN
jgi:hypothetical protein